VCARQELVVPETAKAMVWCGEHLCVGFKKEYNLIDIRCRSLAPPTTPSYSPYDKSIILIIIFGGVYRTGAMRDLFPTGRNSSPLITSLPNQQLLLARDSNHPPYTHTHMHTRTRTHDTWSTGV
jgi:hypothetical protein